MNKDFNLFMSQLQETTGISVPTLRKILTSIAEAGLLKIDKIGQRLIYGIDLKKIDEILK